jgi:hypothetical protein
MLLAGNINIVPNSFFSPDFKQIFVLKRLFVAGMINASPRIATTIPAEPVDSQALRIILAEIPSEGRV